MLTMKRVVVFTIVFASSAALSATATEIVSQDEVRAALRAAAFQRAADAAVLDAALDSPAARAAANRLGADAEELRAVVPTLSNAELRDLAARAEALSSDPAAGLRHDTEDLLVLFLVVALVILVLKAVD